MEPNQNRQRELGREPCDLPVIRDELADRSDARKHDHGRGGADAEHERELEFAEDGGDLLEERGGRCFFGGGAPGHVDAAQVADDGLGDVHGHAAEEGREEEQPLEVLEEAGHETAGFGAVADDGETDGAKGLEDDDDAEVDLEGVDVVLVEMAVEPANEEVVCYCEGPGGAEREVRANVGHDGDFAHPGHVGPDEAAEKWGEGAAGEPVFERVEEEFGAAVGVFLPAGEFVVDG